MADLATAQNSTDAGRAQKPRKPGMADVLSGDARNFPEVLTPVLPSELTGGSVPYIPGTEEDAVWNAAVQACGTERVHYCYTIDDNRCWYLATPSASLASYPDSWCPLAAALPGNSEYWDKETVYLYEQEGQASALRWDPETGRMQLFLGPARTILPRIQSMDANFVTINPAMAQMVPWRNRSLKVDQLSRMAGRLLLFSGLIVAVVAFAFMLIMFAAASIMQPSLDRAKSETLEASNQLMNNASQLLQNDVIKHMQRIQRLLDTLVQIQGTLVRYEVAADGSVQWEALVPKTYSASDLPELAGATPSDTVEKDGRVRIKGNR